MPTTTQRPSRARKPAAAPVHSPAAARLIELIQAEAREKLLAELSAKDDVVILLDHTSPQIEFDDRHGAYYLHALGKHYAIALYRGRPDAASEHPQADGVWWGTEARIDVNGREWSRRIGGLVCDDFGNLVEVAE